MIVHSIIETVCEGGVMSRKRVKRIKKHAVRTKSIYDKNGLFHTTEQTQGKVSQTTNVTVTLNTDKESGCWEAIKSCFCCGKKSLAAVS